MCEPSIYTSPAKSPTLKHKERTLEPPVIPFLASPVVEKCLSSEGERKMDIELSPTKGGADQAVQEQPNDPMCLNPNKDVSYSLGLELDLQDVSRSLSLEPDLQDVSHSQGVLPDLQDVSRSLGLEPDLQDVSRSLGLQPDLQDVSHSLGLEPDLQDNLTFQRNVPDSSDPLSCEPSIDFENSFLYVDLHLVAMDAEVLGCAPFQEADVLAVPNVSLLSQPADTSTINIPLPVDGNSLIHKETVQDFITPCNSRQDIRVTTPIVNDCSMSKTSEVEFKESSLSLVCTEKVSGVAQTHSVSASKEKASSVAQTHSVSAAIEKASSVAQTHSVSQKGDQTNIGDVVSANSQITKRGRGRPRKFGPKIAPKISPKISLKIGPDGKLKRPRGRPRKKRPLTPSIAAVKQEPIDYSVAPVVQHLSPTLLKSSKKKPKPKLTKKDRSDKQTAALIAGVFEKLTSSADSELNRDKSTHQQTVEDSGYTTSFSNSDASSRGSRGPASRSPVENIVSPTLHAYPHSDLSFDDGNQHVLIKANQDPILQGSEAVSHTPYQSEEVDISVLESGGLNTESQSRTLDPISQDTAASVFNLLPSFTFDDVIGGNISMTTASNVPEIFPELDVLLSKGTDDPVHLFDQDEMFFVKPEDLGETREIASYEDVDDILKSETVSHCLRELQLSGRIGGGVTSSETTIVPSIDVPIIPAEVVISTERSPSNESNKAPEQIDSEQNTITEFGNDKTPNFTKKLTKPTSETQNVRRFVKKRDAGVTKSPSLKRIKVSTRFSSPSTDDSLSSNISHETEKDTPLMNVFPLTKEPPLPLSLIHGRTKSGRTCRPSLRLLASFVHQKGHYFPHSLQDNSKDTKKDLSSPTVQESKEETVSTASVGDTGNLSPCEEAATESRDPAVSVNVAESCFSRTRVKDTNGKSPKTATIFKPTKPAIPRVRPPSPVSQASPIYCPGTTIVCHSPKSPFSLKLRDFNVNLSRRPLFGNLSSFSFKLPHKTSDQKPASLKSSCVNKSITDTSLKSPSNVLFSLGNDSKTSPQAATKIDRVIKLDRSKNSLKKAREVKFKDDGIKSSEPLCSAKKSNITTSLSPFVSSEVTASSSLPALKCSSLRTSHPTNSLNMSLDVILSEMENSRQKSKGKQSSVKPRQERVVKMKSSYTQAKSLPILDRLEPIPLENKSGSRVVKFVDSQPSCGLDFDGSLTDHAISDLMLSPLDIDSSLDQVLQGESLFGEKLEKADPFQGPGIAKKSTNSKPSPSQGKTKQCGVSFDKGDKETISSALVTSPRRFTDVTKSSEAKLANLEPPREPIKSPKIPNPFQTIKKTAKSPPKLKQKVSFNFSLSTDKAATSVRQSRDSKSPEKASSLLKPPTKVTVTERKVKTKEDQCFKLNRDPPRKTAISESPEEDVIDLHADDTDMFDTNVSESPLSKIFKKPASTKDSDNKRTLLTEPAGTKDTSRFPHHKEDSKKGGVSAIPPLLSSSPWAIQRKQLSRSPLDRLGTYKQPLMSYPISEGGWSLFCSIYWCVD